MNPQVSIIIPTYNRPQLLTRAVKSILKQTFTRFEILIVQNGSVNHAKNAAEELMKESPAVRFIYLPAAGAVNARNEGVKQSLGEYIAFMDDDDEWLPEKLEKQISFLQNRPDLGMVTSFGYRVNEQGKSLSEIHHQTKNITTESLLKYGCQIYTLSSVLLHKKYFYEAGPFNPVYWIANDYDFYLRFSKKFAIGVVPEFLFLYSWYEDRMSADIRRMFRETCEIAAAHVQGGKKSKVFRNFKRSQSSKTARLYYALAAEARDKKDFKKSAQAYFHSVSFDPMVGLRSVNWSKYQNRFYKFLRPYGALVVCGIKSCLAEKAAS